MFKDKNFQIEAALEEIRNLKTDPGSGEKIVKIEAFAGEFKNFPPGLCRDVSDIYQKKGIESLFSHQAEALEAALKGKNVVVATPTASGKTLVYNAAVLDGVLQNKSARSLYLFPTKALAQDQLAELQELNGLLGDHLALHTYDGDTPKSARPAIRKKGQIVISNPYMLHTGILPHHTRWFNLFENLQYVIIDELHYYTGVFGSHMANVVRRLKRICRFYGSDPVFIMSSATIANPQELAERIIEEEVVLVDRSGAPRGEKYLVFVNPPVVNKELGIRRSYIALARQIAGILLKYGLQIITFANTRLITEVLVKSLKDDHEKTAADEGKVRGYRGGYLPARRREIEQELRKGNIRAVVSTNALELGIDIGSLDAAVLASYPGTVASTWQRLGRAGRRAGKSMGILISSSAPLDQFIVNHPGYFTGKSPEVGRINADNLTILLEHVKCAAFELPFEKGESFGGENLVEILDFLAENRVLLRKRDRWFWTEQTYPADGVSINRISADTFVVVERDREEAVIGQVDASSALGTLYPNAVYILEGEQYLVEELDYRGRRAFVRKSNADYFTEAVTQTQIVVREVSDHGRHGNHDFFFGHVQVSGQVVGFKKLRFFTRENVGGGDLQLPREEMHSTAFWMSVESELLNRVNLSGEEKLDALSGIAYLMRHMAAVMLMCDVKDLGSSVEDGPSGPGITAQDGAFPGDPGSDDGLYGDETLPNIYIYEHYPDGIGFSQVLFEKGDELLGNTLEALDCCNCEHGCPSCVGPPTRSGDNRKDAARFILQLLLDQVYQ